MRRLLRIACCAVLVGAIAPSSAFAALGSAGPGAYSLASALDSAEPEVWPGKPIAVFPYSEDRAIENSLTEIDFDSYTLATTPGTQYTFETTGKVDTVIAIYDANGERVLAWFDNKSATDLSSLGKWTATAAQPQVIVEISSAYADDPTTQNGPYRLSVSASPNTIAAATIKRIDGANRFAVARNAALSIFGTGWKKPGGGQVSDVIVVCGEDSAMADPLAAASLAGWYEAPLLLTNKLSLPSDTSAAITAIRKANKGAVNIRVIGGKGSVTPAVYAKLSALKGTGKIERIEAANRYALAGKIAERLDTVYYAKYRVHPDEVYVANGQNVAAFSDALAVSGFSYKWKFPLLLTQNTGVPAETKALINGRFAKSLVWAVNGPKYLPENVFGAISAEDRMTASSDRYQAALDIAQWGLTGFTASQQQVVVVNKLPDALAAGTFAGANSGIMVYAPATGPSGATATFLSTRKSAVSRATAFGGTASVTPAGLTQIGALLNK